MCILILVSLIGCAAPKPPVTPAPTVVATPEATVVIETVVNADGTVVSLRPALGLSFQVAGRVTEVLVRPGETVKAGQTLARLDTLTLQNAVRDATARLEQSRFDLDRAKRAKESGADLGAAWKGVEAARMGVTNAQGVYSSTLLSSDVTGDVREAKFWADYWGGELDGAFIRLNERPGSEKRREDYEMAGARAANAHNRMLQISQDALNQLSSAQRGLAMAQQSYLSALSSYNSVKNGDPVKQAELQVLLNETALTRAQMDLANVELKAPWDAMIATVDIAPGSQVVGTPVMTMVDISHLQFVTNNLSERDLGRVAMGQKVNLTLKTYPDAKLTGTVAAIAPLAGEPVGDAATFAVRIDLDATDLALRPGMTGQVQIVVK
jgi:HlyD family secretion protein